MLVDLLSKDSFKIIRLLANHLLDVNEGGCVFQSDG